MTDTLPRTPDVSTLGGYVGQSDPSNTYLVSCLTEATELVDEYIDRHGSEWQSKVPNRAHHRAVLEVGAELYHRRQARSGIAMFTNGENPAPVRIARDPMVAAYPFLRPYLPGGFA